MKTNKKAILGFAITMIFSLAIMQAQNIKLAKQDLNVQQLGLAAAGVGYYYGVREGNDVGNGGGMMVGGATMVFYAGQTLAGLSSNPLTATVLYTTPAGWATLGVLGGVAL